MSKKNAIRAALAVGLLAASGAGAAQSASAVNTTSCNTPGRAVATQTNGNRICFTNAGGMKVKIANVKSVYAGKWNVTYISTRICANVRPNQTRTANDGTMTSISLG